MQVSTISTDYSQNTKALDLNHVSDNDTNNKVDKNLYDILQYKNTEKDTLNSAMQEWKNFCHQQILKRKLDIIA